MTEFEGAYDLTNLTTCPKCATMYEEARLGIGQCGTCFVADMVRNFWAETMYLRWRVLPV